MADPNELKRRAEECRQLAAIEPDADDQAFWLRMADEWEKLANLAVRPKERASPGKILSEKCAGSKAPAITSISRTSRSGRCR